MSIPSGEVPTPFEGQAYSFQMVATGGVAPLHWTVVRGTLPAGLTLDDGGLLAGTPGQDPSIHPVQVQVTDGVTSATRLLMMGTLNSDDGGIASTGTPLPGGGAVDFVVREPCLAPPACASPWFGTYSSSGAVAALTTESVATLGDFVGVGRIGSPDGTKAIMADVIGSGPLDVVDATTGALIHQLESSPSFLGWGVWSPDGTRIAVVNPAAGTVRIVDTTTWTDVRTVIPGPATPHRLFWSPDSSEFTTTDDILGQSSAVWSATGGPDRTVDLPGDCSVIAWAASGRFIGFCTAFMAPIDIVSLSASDGSAVHTIYSVPVCGTPPCTGLSSGVVASPDGSHIAFGTFTNLGPPTNGFEDATLNLAPDVDGATLTPLATAATGHLIFAGDGH